MVSPTLHSAELLRPIARAELALPPGLARLPGHAIEDGRPVAVQSEGAGSGADFTLTLPLETEAAASAYRGDHEANSVTNAMRLLLIEDNTDAAESLKEALELNGHEVAIAGTGLEGIEKAHTFRPDVVLCDIGLPGMDGFEVARRMRDDPVLRAACLIALSGYAAPEDLEKSREAGFVQHVAKPPDHARLESTLSEACSSRINGGQLGA